MRSRYGWCGNSAPIAQRCECFRSTTLRGHSELNDFKNNNPALWTLIMLIEFPTKISHNFGLKNLRHFVHAQADPFCGRFCVTIIDSIISYFLQMLISFSSSPRGQGSNRLPFKKDYQDVVVYLGFLKWNHAWKRNRNEVGIRRRPTKLRLQIFVPSIHSWPDMKMNSNQT